MQNPFDLVAKPFTMLAGSVNHTVDQKIVTGIVRHGATAIGGFLLHAGYISSSQSDAVSGALVILLGVVASVAQKKLEAKAQAAPATAGAAK